MPYLTPAAGLYAGLNVIMIGPCLYRPAPCHFDYYPPPAEDGVHAR